MPRPGSRSAMIRERGLPSCMVSSLPKMLALDNPKLYFDFTEAGGYVLNSYLAASAVFVSTYLQLLLLLCGDIELNPGPSEDNYLYTKF